MTDEERERRVQDLLRSFNWHGLGRGVPSTSDVVDLCRRAFMDGFLAGVHEGVEDVASSAESVANGYDSSTAALFVRLPPHEAAALALRLTAAAARAKRRGP